jgi:hypothetical protein
MKRLFSMLLAVVLLAGSPLMAASHGSSHGSRSSHSSRSESKKTKKDKDSASSGVVHVKGYTKRDGTHVDVYDRRAPKEAETAPVFTDAATTPRACATCERDKDGRIKRSGKARAEFMRHTGYSKGRPGYVVDHIIPLECGGADTPSNMQWQTALEAKLKDRTERACR